MKRIALITLILLLFLMACMSTPGVPLSGDDPLAEPTAADLDTRTETNAPEPTREQSQVDAEQTNIPESNKTPAPVPTTQAVPTDTPILPTPEQVTDEINECIPEQEGQAAQVVNVVDGDTIDVLIDGQELRVRYIGIDTPETVHPSKPVDFFGPEASSKNKELVDGKEVVLFKDVSDTDRYGRLLRFIIVDGVFVNYEMVRQGYANASRYPPDVACADTFSQAEREARETGVGLWGEQPTTDPTIAETQPSASGSSGISIGYIFYDGIEGRNEPDEYVEITNNGGAAVDLAG
jgi:micrococcal nuclease